MSESSESTPLPPGGSGEPADAAPAQPQPAGSFTPPAYGQAPGPGYGQTAAYPQTGAYPQTAAYPQAGYSQGAGYPPYQSYGYPYPGMPGMQPQLPKGMAITGMVLGIVGLVLSFIVIGGVMGIVGLIFSIIALRAAGRGQGGGRGMAIAGLVTSIVSILGSAVILTIFIAVGHSVDNCDSLDPSVNPNSTYLQYDNCIGGIGT